MNFTWFNSASMIKVTVLNNGLGFNPAAAILVGDNIMVGVDKDQRTVAVKPAGDSPNGQKVADGKNGHKAFSRDLAKFLVDAGAVPGKYDATWDRDNKILTFKY